MKSKRWTLATDFMSSQTGRKVSLRGGSIGSSSYFTKSERKGAPWHHLALTCSNGKVPTFLSLRVGSFQILLDGMKQAKQYLIQISTNSLRGRGITKLVNRLSWTMGPKVKRRTRKIPILLNAGQDRVGHATPSTFSLKPELWGKQSWA